MRIPFSYSLRNLWTRKVTTLLTVSGMALVVYVFAAVLMLSEGLRKTLKDTGSFQNAIIVRRSADAEVMSLVQRSEAAIIETQPEIAQDQTGAPLISREVIVLVALPKTGGGQDTFPGKSKGPHSADLHRSIGHSGIHGHHGPDHGPEGKDNSHRQSEDANKKGHHLRLIGIELGFPFNRDCQTGIALQTHFQSLK
jgi:hypothetical protein